MLVDVLVVVDVLDEVDDVVLVEVVVDVLDEVEVDVLVEVVVGLGQIASGPQFSPVHSLPHPSPVHSQAQSLPSQLSVTSSDEVAKYRN